MFVMLLECSKLLRQSLALDGVHELAKACSVSVLDGFDEDVGKVEGEVTIVHSSSSSHQEFGILRGWSIDLGHRLIDKFLNLFWAARSTLDS